MYINSQLYELIFTVLKVSYMLCFFFHFRKIDRAVATTIEITTTIEIIISKVVENAFQTKHHIATTIEITTTIEIIISIVVENNFKLNFTSQPLMK